MRRSRKFEEAYTVIGTRPSQEEMELPTSIDGETPNTAPKKTQARRDFEGDPGLLLRDQNRGLSGSMTLDLSQPSYPVDARWQIVCKNVHNRYRPETIADPLIKRGCEFLNAYLDLRDDADRDALVKRFPDIHAAFEIYRGCDRFIRGRLEGCLLTQHSFEDVAVICQQTLATIQTYENLFFDVRSRLAHRLLIQGIAFDGKFWDGVYGGITENDVDIMLKMAGLLQGGVMFKPMIKYFTSGWQLPKPRSCPTRSELVALKEILCARVLILTWVLPPEKMQRAVQLNNLLLELRQIIEAWPDGADPLNKSPFELPPASDEQLDAWWNSWRKAVQLALRKSPAHRGRTKVA